MTENSSSVQILRLEEPKLDPFGLSQYIKSDLRNEPKKLAEFYEKQNEMIESFLTPVAETDEHEDEMQMLQYKIAMYGSLGANCILFVVQFTAALLTGSLALFATTLDAFMDVISNLVLFVTGRIAASENFIVYPTGKNRYKAAGIIVFATLMATLSLQIWSQSIQTLIAGDHVVTTELISILLVVSGISVKFFLYLYCRLYTKYPSIAILAQDHLNDIMFNSTGIILSFLASKYYWWIDPVGAIIIAGFILKSWATTAYENILYIVGVSAEPSIINRLVYIAVTHDERILKVDTVKAYHSGHNVFVEVDICLPREMSLKEAHDIGEDLQFKLEALQEVDRAFVHLDYEVDHKPEHFKRFKIE